MSMSQRGPGMESSTLGATPMPNAAKPSDATRKYPNTTITYAALMPYIIATTALGGSARVAWISSSTEWPPRENVMPPREEKMLKTVSAVLGLALPL